MKNLHSKRMRSLIEYTSTSLTTRYPSPFGASIYNVEGKLVTQMFNTVIKNEDPTCHGEINAIRDAVKKTGSRSLSGYVLYSTCEPCPMCMSACIWAEIATVVFGATIKEDASLYWKQFLDMTAEELTTRMQIPKCTVIPYIERELSRKLMKSYELAPQ